MKTEKEEAEEEPFVIRPYLTDKFTLFGFLRVLCIVCAAFQTGRHGFSLIFVQRNQACCGHAHHLPQFYPYIICSPTAKAVG